MQTDFLRIIDILGTFAFAVSGASMAIHKKLDVFGVLVIAFVTSVGGGTIRDIMIGNLPVNWLQNEVTILVILISTGITLFFRHRLQQLPVTLFLFDAMGLGLFTIAGVELAVEKGFSMGICISLGTITACFGGVLRDVLLNQVPLIFRKEIYATACVAGALFYFLFKYLHIDNGLIKILCIVSIVLIRVLAVKYKWAIPQIGSLKQS